MAGDANETLKTMLYRTVGERDDARETIARLERERDEARRDLRVLATGVFPEVEAERDAARADAARMRLMLEALYEDVQMAESVGICLPDRVATLNAEAALTPDDGWLARKIEEAVEPYREALLHSANAQHMTCTTDRFIRLEVCTTPVCIEAASLLGGTPTKEGE